MECFQYVFTKDGIRNLLPVLVGSIFAVVLILPPATADAPADMKRVAFEAIDRNAEQIATVGDVLYYFAEPGMQEYESSKYVKETLERAGFTVELGGAGMPTNVWASGDRESRLSSLPRKWTRFLRARRLQEVFLASRSLKARPDTWRVTMLWAR